MGVGLLVPLPGVGSADIPAGRPVSPPRGGQLWRELAIPMPRLRKRPTPLDHGSVLLRTSCETQAAAVSESLSPSRGRTRRICRFSGAERDFRINEAPGVRPGVAGDDLAAPSQTRMDEAEADRSGRRGRGRNHRK